jgi:hypothetical protein
MKRKRPLVIELLRDTYDDEEDVIIFESKGKKRPKSIVTARAQHRADDPSSGLGGLLAKSKENSSVNLSIAELKHSLAMRGISSHGCIEK